MMSFGLIFAIVHGMCLPFLLIVFGTTIDEFASYSITTFCEENITVNCTSRSAARDDLIDEINHPIVLYYVIIGAVTIISGWIQLILFQISAGRQVKKIRTAFFCAILKQEISWFDLNATGEINSRLNK